MTITPPTIADRAHLDKFFSRVDPVRGRLVFCVDATASRQGVWDVATQLITRMFGAVVARRRRFLSHQI